MKKVSLLLVSLLTVFVTSLSMVAFAAPSDENPYKNHYTKEAQAIRKQGTAKIVFQFMCPCRASSCCIIPQKKKARKRLPMKKA